MERLTIIIPTREAVLPPENITLQSLGKQTWRDFRVGVVHDVNKHGASWARNVGFRQLGIHTELVLFCDDDIDWRSDALAVMLDYLDGDPEASYVYCGYTMGRHTYCMEGFDPARLKKLNYISTMSIIRTKDFPLQGFDENIRRFQDWDLWLCMLQQGKYGVWCGKCLFSTARRPGITHGNPITPQLADSILRKKYGAWMES